MAAKQRRAIQCLILRCLVTVSAWGTATADDPATVARHQWANWQHRPLRG